ncbi:MAG: response regulator [Phycisphaerales bacterium]|nr:response regulator [Phycisphaerales bacterium]
MTQSRAKLLVTGGDASLNDEVRRLLAERFGGRVELVPAAPGSEAAAPLAMLAADAMPDGAALFSVTGQVLWANARFHALDAGTKSKVATIAAAAVASWNADTGRPVTDLRHEVSASDLSAEFEIVLSRPAAPSGAAPFSGAVVVVHDITAAKRRRFKMEAIERAGGDLLRLDADAVRKLNAVERLRALEGKVVAYAHDLLHFDHFGIRLLDERSGKLELVMSAGLPPTYADIDIYPLPEGHGISGYVAATGQSYRCDDAGNDSMFLPGLTGARSSLTVPLKVQDRVLGILNVESQQPAAFTDEDRLFAEIFARAIAMAVHTLDLLVVERSTVNRSVSSRVEDELAAPLADIVRELELLHHSVPAEPETKLHITRIGADVESIRERIREVAAGPTTLLGVERAMASSTRDAALAGRHVLVADDEPKIRRIIGDVLRHRGCEVTVCDSGVSAIEAISARAAAGQRYELIISDIKMPDRNGYEVFSAVRRLMGEVPVILMTGFGYDPHHSIVRASQEGLQAVLFKPFPVERLIDEVKKGLASQSKPAT